MTRLFAGLLVCCWFAALPAPAASQSAKDDGVSVLLRKIEQVLQSGDAPRYLDLL